MRKSIVVWLFLLILLPVIPAEAEGIREVRTYLYREYTDCVFLVSWENREQEAAVELTSSDGTVIVADASNAVFGEGNVSVTVENAQSGYWTVRLTGESLGAVSVSGGSRTSGAVRYNAVQSFDVDISGGYVHFKWNVLSEQDTVNVNISAWQGEESDYGSRTVWSDYSADRNGEASVSADDLATGLYHFSIQVYDGTGQYTLSTEEALYVAQSNAPARIEGIRSGSIDGELYITWDAWGAGNYVVTLYDYDTLSVIKSESVATNFYVPLLEDGRDRIKYSVAIRDGNAWGKFDVFPLVCSTPAGSVVFPDVSVTKESAVAVRIDCPAGSSAGVYLDGKLLLADAGTGAYDLNLSEGEHQIVGYIEDENGNMKTFSKAMSVDRTPPAVTLTGSDYIRTKEVSLTISGSTEPNAIVAVNGVEQELGTGRFTAKLTLEEGVNPITVTAYDQAGNKSVRTITAELDTGFGSWTRWILPGILSVILVMWYAFLNKKAGNKGGR